MSEQPKQFGPYVLLKSLGSGGTGDVALAKPVDPGRGVPSPVVIKRLHGQLADQGDFVKRFRHEAELAVAVDSKHVAKVYDVGRVGDTFYLAMEYLPGWTLARLISDMKEAGHRATPASVVDIVGGALNGLQALHNAKDPKTGLALGIVHRDIAPKNIMVGEDGTTRLIDLGLGKSSIQDWRTSTGMVMGTPGYMAPEQVAAETVDHRADLYAMGIVLWEFLVGERYIKKGPVPVMLRAQLGPKFEPPSRFRNDIPAALDQVSQKALALEPADRFQSAFEMAQAMEAAVGKGDREEPLATIVGEMLWGELGQAKTEMTALLSLAAPTPSVGAASMEIEVFAERHGLERTGYVPDPSATPAGRPFEIPSNSGPMAPMHSASLVQPARGVPLKAVIGLMALTLALGIGVGGVLLNQTTSEAPLVTKSPTPPPTLGEPAPAPPPAPGATAVANEAPSASPNSLAAANSDRNEPRRVRKDPGTTAPPPPARVEDNKQPEKAPAPPVEAHARVNQLIAKVRAAKAGFSPGTPEANEASQLIGTLAREAAKDEIEPGVLKELEARVLKLER